jgi:hypothetical protein
MQELKPTTARGILIPTKIKRYQIAYYSKAEGWRQHGFDFYATPESALEDFLRMCENIDDKYKPTYYTILEVELEMPVR